jgi:hypothetical protein
LACHLAGYLETPGMDDGYDAINLQRVALLPAGDALPALPDEAFAARPGRRHAEASCDRVG